LHRDNADELTAIVRVWDGIYRKRIKVTLHVAVTTAHFVQLTNPPFINDAMLIEAFGLVPGTLNPTNLGLERINYLLSLAGVPTVE
jgi:hypothetical protein